MKRKWLAVGIILLFVGTCIIPAIAQCIEKTRLYSSSTDWWTMFHHDSEHSGYSTSSAPETNATVWVSKVGYQVGFSSPAIVDGRVYICSDYWLSCLDANLGIRLWRYGVDDYVDTSPAVADGKVYFGSTNNKVYCLNAKIGMKIWEYTTDDFILSSPTVINEKVFIGSSDGKLYCLDAGTGTKIWEYPTGFQIASSPAVSNGKVYVGSGSGKIYCLDANLGEELWNRSMSGMSSPTVAHGKVYCVGNNQHNGTLDLLCLNADNGTSIWVYSNLSIGASSPAVAYGKVFVGSFDNNVYCFNADTGLKIWNYTTGDRIWGSPAVADGKLFIGSQDHKVYCLDANTGEKIWDYTTGFEVGSSPAVADGKVYIGSFDGNVYCFGNQSGVKKAFIFGRYTNLTTVGDNVSIVSINLRIILFKPFDFQHYIAGEKITFLQNYSRPLITPRFIIGRV